MAKVKIPELEKVITDPSEIKAYLASVGIGFEQWDHHRTLSKDMNAEEVLNAFATEIEELKKSGGYVAADVVHVTPDTPNLDAMLNRFNKEHWHDEDEVRFFIEGRGLFHINPKTSPVLAVEVEKGDLLRVPAGTLHWFDACGEKQFRAIRLFQDPSGWTPHYTESGVDKGYMPVCFGLTFIPPQFAGL